jgi:hypothetical protein
MSPQERKYSITGQFVPGQILIGPNDGDLFVYEETKKGHLWGYSMGTISRNYEGVEYASFIFNTKNGANKVGIRKDRGKIPSEKDKKLIQNAFNKKINLKYLNLVKEKSGLNPFV